MINFGGTLSYSTDLFTLEKYYLKVLNFTGIDDFGKREVFYEN